MIVIGIIGPSGCGKSAAVHELVARGIVDVTPTYTERPRRRDEEELEHKFVSSKEFDAYVAQGMFLEVVRPFGLPFRYGLPQIIPHKAQSVHVVMVRAPFVSLLKKHYPDCLIFQIERSRELAEAELTRRQDESIGTRLNGFDEEIALGRKLADKVFVNDGTLTALVDKIEAALTT